MADKQEKEKSTRRAYRDDNWTEEEVKAKRASLTVEEAPKDWVKVSEVGDACREAGIPVSKFVRAFGGDRGMSPPADPVFKFVYVGRTRYVSGDCLTKGLKLLADPTFLKTTRKRKKKEEGAESGPVTGTKTTAKKAPKKVAVRPKA
jgi:hypothetical protein